MLKKLGHRALLLTSIVALSSLAIAGPIASQVFEITDRNKVAYCGILSKSWEPVYLATDGTFQGIAGRLRALEKKIPKAKGNARKKLEKEKTTLTGIQSRTRKVCARGPAGTPPDPGTTPTPTPTPTPESGGFGCFLSGGNIKPGCFGIPTNITANLNRGETYFLGNCTGCHERRPPRTYQEVKQRFREVSEMQPFEPGEQDLADVIAYLNRGNF